MTYRPSSNWKPSTKEEITAFNKKFDSLMGKHGIELFKIASVFEEYLNAADIVKDCPYTSSLNRALIQFDSIVVKSVKKARLTASRIKKLEIET